MRKTDKFLWKTEMQQDFETLKQEFQIGIVQAYPDFCFGEPFHVNTNWSKYNITGILSQNQEGEEKFIECWGRKCNQYERNYPSYKGELLIQCIKKWEHILRYRPFEIYADASALKYIDSMKNQLGLFMPWYAQLAGYVFKVIHKKWKEKSNTDALSRAKNLVEQVNEVEFHQISQEAIRRKQETDTVWKEALVWVENGESPSLRELGGKEQEELIASSLFSPELFQILNNMLLFQSNTDKNRTEPAGRICVPNNLEYLS